MIEKYPALTCPNCGYGELKFYLPGEDYNWKKPCFIGFKQDAIVRLEEKRWFCTICRYEWDDVGRIYAVGSQKIVKSDAPRWIPCLSESKDGERK